MKKLLIVLALIAMLVGVVYAADYLTSDPTIQKAMAYGETAAGEPVKLLVEADGTLQIS